MKRWFVGCALLLAAIGVRASSLDETFREGVLGVPWGTTLEQLVGIYPSGDHIFSNTPGCRAYWVKDGQTFLSVPRPRSGVLYGLDESNRVAVAAIAFEYERQLELRSMLAGMFGSPITRSKGDVLIYGWKSTSGMRAAVREFGEGQQRMIWFSIFTSGYRSSSESCFDVPR